MEYAFVLDADGKRLDPTKIQKAWYMIRHDKAKLVELYPMTIKLNRVIPNDEVNKGEKRLGIDDGSLHVGLAIVQKCNSYNKVLFKGTIEQRNDVKKKIEIRRGYRRYRRSQKRYREKRFYNRASSKRSGRIAPSIFQKRQATLRVVNKIKKYVNIDSIWLEDVAIDIRALTDEYKPYRWQYQKSNRLDENIRKAVIMRDGCKCMMCGKGNIKLEVHHIKPKRLNGSNTLRNLITLCENCHDKTEGNENKYEDMFFELIMSNGDTMNLNHGSHVMIGKSYLRKELSKLAQLFLTNGGDTSNKRIDWGIEKSHSNDAICITGFKPSSVDIKEWIIKPQRRKRKGKHNAILNITYRDIVEYTYKNGETHRGYVTALYPNLFALNFQSRTKHCKKVNAKKCKLIYKTNSIYWLSV